MTLETLGMAQLLYRAFPFKVQDFLGQAFARCQESPSEHRAIPAHGSDLSRASQTYLTLQHAAIVHD